MQKNLSSDLSATRTTEVRAEALPVRSAPFELDLSVLKHVGGGGPNGNWAVATSMASTDGPNGNWI